ncbi:predicted protein [Coccidioides posadasii str. Silveira]|uniref:Predicted protein n=2 Tax=Coccidioides posadasii TaxID=199306 RepID=E9DJ96_COCPS|nr:predicted protein [Coccidioides posadasii str. Silveira]KMM69357.1 hypothetical protein CPAG_05673 [Coccidioides posadasii RMSCC 3488]
MVEIHITVLLPKAQLRLPRADGTEEDCTIRDRPLANKEEDPLEKEEDSDFDFWVMGEKSMGGVERTRGRGGRAKRRGLPRQFFFSSFFGERWNAKREQSSRHSMYRSYQLPFFTTVSAVFTRKCRTIRAPNPRSSETFDIIQLAFTPWTGCY